MIKKNKQKLNTSVDKTEGGFLALMWRKIITDTGLAAMQVSLLNNYKRRGGKRNRGTIQSYFTAGSLTWKNLIFLIFKILPVKKLTVTFTLTYTDNTQTSHSLDFDNSTIDNNDSMEEIKNIKKENEDAKKGK